MKPYTITYNILLQLLLLLTFWLTTLAASAAPPVSPSVSGYETLEDEVNTAAAIGPTWRPFSDDSPWNTPIGDHPLVDPASKVYIQQINNFCQERTGRPGDCIVSTTWYDWGIPVYFVDNITPYPEIIEVPAHSGWGHDLSAPIPSFAQPDPAADAHLSIIDRHTGEEWDFWEIRGSYPNLTSGHGRKIPDGINGSGVLPPYMSGARESGFPLSAGLIRPEELQAGEIRHALVFGHDGRNGWDQFVYPASTGSDFGLGPSGNQVLPMGARLQLKSEVDISGLTPAAQVIARALKKYGMYLGEETDGKALGIYMQTVGDENNDGVVEYWNELWAGIWGQTDAVSLSTLTASDFRVIELPSVGGDRPPRVTISEPADESSISEAITVNAMATDEDGAVSFVAFYLDNETTPRHTVTSSAYSWDLDTATLAPGSHVIRAVAEDNKGAHSWDSVRVTVSPKTPAELAIDEPVVAGATVVKGNGSPGASVVVRDLGDGRIVAEGQVNNENRYEIDLASILGTYQLRGLEAGHKIRAESDGQIYQTIVQYQTFLPVVSK